MNLADVLVIPDRYDWITGRWAEELASGLSGFRVLTLPSWCFVARPSIFRTIIARAKLVVNLDPWFAGRALSSIQQLKARPLLSNVLHHVNIEDPNASAVAAADLPVAACEVARDHLMGILQHSKDVLLVENGVDLEEFRPGDRASARAWVGLSSDDFVIGFSGKTSSDHKGRKGLDVLLEVVAALAADSRFKFVLCGEAHQAFRRQLDLASPNVRHLGFVGRADLGTFYNSLDALIMTSRIEAGPAGVLEAMACGVTTVASKTGIVPKVVQQGENGYCTEAGDAAAVVAALRALESDRERCRSMGARARATVERGWGWSSKMAPFAGVIRGHLYSQGTRPSSWRIMDPLRRSFEGYVRHVESTRRQLR